MSFQYNPVTGLMDMTVYPTKPTSETAARQQFMDLFNQVGTELNALKADVTQREINVKSSPYNAVGDGVTDDTAAIQNAMNNIPLGYTLVFPPGIYIITSKLVMSRKINLKGIRGSSILKGDVSELIGVATPATIMTTNMNGALTSVTDTITLNSVIGILPGHMIYILDDSRQWPYDARTGVFYGELNSVKSVNSGTNQVTLFTATKTDYPTNTKIYVYDPISDFEIDGLTIERQTKSLNTDCGLTFLYTRNVIIKDITVIGFGGAGILDYLSDSNMYQNIKCRDTYYSGTVDGYGIQVGGSVGTIVSNSIFYNCKRGVDFSGTVPSRYCVASGCESFVDASFSAEFNGFGTHGSSQYCKFANCKVYGGKNAFLIRGTNIIIDSCEAYGTSNFFAALGAGYDHSVINCKTDKPYTTDFYTSAFINISSPDYTKGVKTLTVKNCEIRCTDWVVQISSTTPACDIYLENLRVTLRFGGKKFITTDNMASAQIYNLFIDNISLMDSGGTQITFETQPGTNATINTKSKNNSTWNGTHILLGSYHLWIDSTGRLRIKSSAPTSDTDGSPFATRTQSATAVSTATSGTIATAGLSSSRVSPAAAITGVILQAGTFGGQEIIVINEAASANTITFAASGSNVADGSSDVISGVSARKFIWDSGNSLWYRVS